MSINVKTAGASVSVIRVGHGDNFDVFRGDLHAGIGCDPVFRAGVAVADKTRREARHRVIIMSDTIATARVLRGEVGGESLVCDARAAVGELDEVN